MGIIYRSSGNRKEIKALFVKIKRQHSAFSHDLLRLIKNTGVEIPLEFADWLDTITSFNINARFEDYKQNFAKLCTKEYTEEWIKKIELIREWLINQL